MRLNDSCAAIPAESCIVIVFRSEFFGPFVEFHGSAEPVEGDTSPTWCGAMTNRLSASFRNDPGIVFLFVFTRKTGGDLLRLLISVCQADVELVGQRQQESDVRSLIVWIDRKHVPTDTLGILWFVEQPIAHCFFEGSFDGRFRKTLEIEHIVLVLVSVTAATNGDSTLFR